MIMVFPVLRTSLGMVGIILGLILISWRECEGDKILLTVVAGGHNR